MLLTTIFLTLGSFLASTDGAALHPTKSQPSSSLQRIDATSTMMQPPTPASQAANARVSRLDKPVPMGMLRFKRGDDAGELDTRPTPDPTGAPSDTTTVHITSQADFSLLLPGRQDELVSDAESDGVSFCSTESTDPGCANRQKVQDGFITAAAYASDPDGAWVQVTGCIDPSKSTLDPSDAGGQMDVRFPNGAQCTFGGFGASFIELVEPALNRFCIRCCRDKNDQTNCNSHRDRLGCETAIPGTYDFPEVGISCS